MSVQEKPVPVPNELTAPYWEAARQGQLAIQRCTECGHYHHPPRSLCQRCRSERLQYEPVSGRGTIYSYTVARQTVTRGFFDEVPYAVLVVELEEQPELLLVANLVGDGLDRLDVGLPVIVDFEDRSEVTLPQFRLA